MSLSDVADSVTTGGSPAREQNAILVPSGDHAGPLTSKSPLVTCRGVAPCATSITKRCARVPSSSPSASLLNGSMRMCRAPLFASWKMRAVAASCGAVATNARRFPSGAHASAVIFG